jgi:hypothetical protein
MTLLKKNMIADKTGQTGFCLPEKFKEKGRVPRLTDTGC